MMEMDYTRKFNLQNDKDPEIRGLWSRKYEKGWEPRV